jgi:hypothetical protein
MPVAGGETVRVLQGVPGFAWWKVAPGGIYFVDGSTTPAPLRFLAFATGRVKALASLDLGYMVPRQMTFDVSPDGQWILFQRTDQVESDIMLVENFR